MHYGASESQTALFTEHSNADKKKRRTVADSVANVGESVGFKFLRGYLSKSSAAVNRPTHDHAASL